MSTMSEDPAERVRQLRTAVDQARLKRARAESTRDAAAATLDQVRAKMKAEFGIETVDEAKPLLQQLKSELDTSIAEAFAALSAIS